MNTDIATFRGDHIYEFDKFSDIVSSIKGNSIVNFNINKDYSSITKQNGYRILSIEITKDDKYFYPDIEGAYCPIFTYVSSRFKDTKGIATPIYPNSFRDGKLLSDWDIDNFLDFSGFELYLGDGYINIYLPMLQSVTNCFDSFNMAIIMDMMYDIRKDSFAKLLNIFN